MKLPHHILPAYPALALLTATFVYAWTAEPTRYARHWMRNATATLIVVGVGLIVALPVVAVFVLPGEGLIGLVGMTLVAGGGLCFHFNRRGQAARTMTTFAVTSVAFLTAMFGFAVLRVDVHQNAPALAAELQEAMPEGYRLAAYRYFRESFVYYTGGPVTRCHSTDDLDEFLSSGDNAYVVTVDEHERLLREKFPGRFEVVARRPRFLGRGEVVLLGRRRASSIAPASGMAVPSSGAIQTAVRPSANAVK